MTIQTVNIGTTPNDGTGDPARTAFTKLNSNFTQAENAASKLVATNAQALAGTAGVLPDASGVHAAFNQYGIGVKSTPNFPGWYTEKRTGYYFASSIELFPGSPSGETGAYSVNVIRENIFILFKNVSTNAKCFIGISTSSTTPPPAWVELRSTGNTTVDPNGFIKAASPIASLYSDRAESNGSAELEAMQFERIGTGHYRLTGVPELSREGWYIETPKDRNGNVYFTLDYVESDGVLDIYTYTPDYSTGRAENGEPVDILEGRFVSLRFSEAEHEPEETAE